MSEENISQVDEKYCLDDTLLPSAETNHVNLRQFQTGALVKRQTKIDEPVRSEKKKSITSGKNQSSEKRIFRCSGRKSLKLIPSLCSSSDMVKESQVTRSDPRPIKQTSSSSSKTCLSEKKEIISKVTSPPMKLKVVEPIRSDLGPIRQTSSSSSKTCLSERKEIGSKVTSPPMKLKVVEPIRSDLGPIRQTSSSSSKTCLSEKKEIGSKVTSPPMKLKVVEPMGSDPRPIRQTCSSSKTGLSEKKEIGYANLVTNSNTESKTRPERIGSKITSPPMIVEPKPEDSNQTLVKFKNRTVQEPKLNGKKINLRDKREGIEKTNDEGEGKKVVLRHRKMEEKERLQKLYNNVIEETVNKFEEGRKSKVKALVGAFETVISLQDEKTQTFQTKRRE